MTGFPFRGVTSSRPYPPTKLGTGGWRAVPTEKVAFSHLTLTQRHADIPALWGFTSRAHLNDDYPHVVAWDGQLYLEDGHNRVVRAALTANADTMPMRVFRPRSTP